MILYTSKPQCKDIIERVDGVQVSMSDINGPWDGQLRMVQKQVTAGEPGALATGGRKCLPGLDLRSLTLLARLPETVTLRTDLLNQAASFANNRLGRAGLTLGPRPEVARQTEP
jgi:hypothetical protein